MELITEITVDNKVYIKDIKDARSIKELPRDYYQHVPYMYWMWHDVESRDSGIKNKDTGFLLVNYIGGLDHIYIDSIYSLDDWEDIKRHIKECADKLYKTDNGLIQYCPHCGTILEE